MKRVVVTGLGAVSPCGRDIESSWSSAVAGKSGIERIELFDPTDYASQIAGECREFDPEQYIEKRRLREMARFVHLAMGASQQAIERSGLDPQTDEERERVGTFIGVGFCGMEVVEEQHSRLVDKGPRRVSPYFIPSAISNMAPGQVSMRWGYKGPSFTTTSACSSGAHAIGEAARWIQRGAIDAAVAGGAEASVTPLGVAGFASMRALSKRNDAPHEASRPFDAGRDGFVIAEGAGVVVLESLESAQKRGAPILAEVIGYGATADAYHLTQPAPEGEGAQRAMKQALNDARISAADVDYINAHGTSTPTGDVQELQAIRSVFGSHAQDGLLISSTKSVTGHLLGAAGGLEAVFAVKSIVDSVAPPTINLTDPDPACEGLDLVPNEARQAKIKVALNNSFGFGGTNVSLIFRGMQ
ncbi:MAG: beta-ketoacyl-[acyl-carrier-protein] synthase II [Sandaracinus sp.]|mgnify:CR=1 FL=1|nr:beta-ketoacyl-[acyl-carrier-protein] synthase II [Sandaracinus sp.]